jgi:DNA-binding CsgD family transcriptional regulator
MWYYTESEVQTLIAIDADTMTAVEDLLRKILQCLNEEAISYTTNTNGHQPQEVVLDLKMEGMHYTLLRVHAQPSQAWVSLSPREKEVIRLVCLGLPNKAISDVLEISPWTVGSYLKRIFAKLGVCSRAEMVARALNERLLDNHFSSSEATNGQPMRERMEIDSS